MLSAKNDFDTALAEVTILLNYAKRNARNMSKYSLFNKAAIVLLCSKFEAFVESFLAEYAYEMCNRCDSSSLDKSIFNCLSEVLIEELEKNKKNIPRRNATLSKIADLHSNTPSPVNTFNSNPKFKYGKHGQKEMTRLLTRFGFGDFNSAIIIDGFYSNFNSLLNIRNNIVHEDATPSLTHLDVKNYLDLLNDFSNKIDRAGTSKIVAL